MQQPSTTRTSSIADSIGILASGLCAIHCILIPVLLLTGTVVPASFFTDEGFHKATLWLILPAALIGLGLGCRRHKDRTVLTLGVIGAVGIAVAGTVLHEWLGETGERVATVIFATMLIVAHYRNYRLCRSADCEHEVEASV
ncbi:MAG: MerC domain-containing protein [Pseudomonadota bacterium]